jgi:hypothetical protein
MVLKVYFLDFLSFLQAEDEYMISDFDLFVTKFVSVPKEMGHLNCNAFVAGIVGGVLDGAGFPARCVEYRIYFFVILFNIYSGILE